ncbi:MAG: DUF1080 domain-containing protein [Planctomycetia bacterium]|nr:DUF1080 domain-containing protein [Planctomycetia bacterium]
MFDRIPSSRPALFAALLLALACPALAADDAKQEPIRPTDDVIRLFNGKDLEGWTTWLGDTKYEDPRKIFTVEDGMLHISGDGLGYIRTNQAYRDYHLVAEFKWGPRTWAPRQKCTKDSGILVHCIGPDGGYGNAFMVSFEAQIIQGGVGDFIIVPGTRDDTKNIPISLSAEVAKDRDGESVWHKGGEKKAFTSGRINWYGRDPDWADTLGFRGKNDVESPDLQWTRMDVICDGNRITMKVNGVTVNEGFDASHTAGKILLQTELAEIFFRRVELWPLGKAPTGER